MLKQLSEMDSPSTFEFQSVEFKKDEVWEEWEATDDFWQAWISSVA
jgi:hypothetical protein